tara:strand:+ start:61504 stop:61887 length:384 start_codon:yes stop_codon:yes gene_type:complete
MSLKITPSDKKEKKDFLRIKGNAIEAKLNIFSGKQGDHFLTYSPSLKISGYGSTEKEAIEFIKLELETFCEDVFSMNTQERENYILSLGFKKEKFHTKNFSKAYIDENGRLQDFDPGTIKHEVLETA